MRGGKRIGAGRKKGFAAKSAEKARKLLSERVAEEIVLLSNMLIKRAKAGDIRAVHELLDRAWGRPFQSVQLAVSESESMFKTDKAMLEATAHIYGELVMLKKVDGADMAEVAKQFSQWYRENVPWKRKEG